MDGQLPEGGNAAFVVTRKVAVPGVGAPDAPDAIRSRLDACVGVLAVDTDGRYARVHITYDASQVGFDHLIGELEAAGYPVARDLWSRVKRTWFRYLDGNARANAGGGSAACCSRPSDVYATRSRRH
ncbi:MAG: hypothetical protein WCC36_13300 [Gammaproteobacteria bacterium]